MKSALVALLGFLGAGVLACSAAEPEDALGASTSDLTATLSASELSATKKALRALANDNMGRTDNADEVRAKIDPLVAKLQRHFGVRAATAKLPLVEGAWRQLWTDYPFPMTPFISMDATQVYQVVSADGHYWNIGDEKAIGIFGLTGVLRGAFEPSGTKIALQFTDVGFRFGRLSRRENLVDLASGLESGDRYFTGLPGGGRAPKGPVSIKGTLETLYVDADLRVDRGTQEDFLGEDGAVLVEGYGPKIFVLDRVTTPAK